MANIVHFPSSGDQQTSPEKVAEHEFSSAPEVVARERIPDTVVHAVRNLLEETEGLEEAKLVDIGMLMFEYREHEDQEVAIGITRYFVGVTQLNSLAERDAGVINDYFSLKDTTLIRKLDKARDRVVMLEKEVTKEQERRAMAINELSDAFKESRE